MDDDSTLILEEGFSEKSIVSETESKKREEKSAGIYEVDFSNPLTKENLEVVEHKGEVFYYEPTKTKLYSLLQLGFKSTDLILDLKKINKIHKELEKRGEKVLPDNIQPFLEGFEPDVPTEWFSYFIIFIGTIRRNFNGSLVVLQMYGNDYTKTRVFKYKTLDEPMGKFTRIACY